MFSTCSSVAYHERVTLNNDMDVDLPIDFPTLSYEEEQEKNICLRKVAETTNSTRLQGVNNEASSTQVNHDNHVSMDNMCVQTPCVDDVIIINIQLPCDPNGPTEPNLWSGNFQSISLHGSVEHIASDSKNIKQSLNFMAKYIFNKKVNPKSSNDLNDFDGISDTVWNFYPQSINLVGIPSTLITTLNHLGKRFQLNLLLE